MDKYYFIQLGAQVLYNDGTDNGILMQVCCPIKENCVKDDTRIRLISVNSEEPEEVCESYVVRADELSPVLSEFNKGYWCAVQDAIMNGVNEAIIRSMLQAAGFSFWECQYHMEDNDIESEQLRNIVRHMFCQYPNIIDWNGANYPTKEIVLYEGTIDEEVVTVSVERLEHQLCDDMGNWSTREAEAVDEQIFFYLDDETFNWPDKDIAEFIEDALRN